MPTWNQIQQQLRNPNNPVVFFDITVGQTVSSVKWKKHLCGFTLIPLQSLIPMRTYLVPIIMGQGVTDSPSLLGDIMSV